MSIAREIIDSVMTGYEEMITEKERISKELELYKLRQLDLLHMIESDERFDACKGYKYAKELQQTIKKIKELQDELESLNILAEGYSKKSVSVLTKISKEVKTKDQFLADLKANQVYVNRTKIVDGKIKRTYIKVNTHN